MSEQPSQPEAEVKEPGKPGISRRGFLRFGFGRSKTENNSDESDKPDESKLSSFIDKFKRRFIPSRRQMLKGLLWITAGAGLHFGPEFYSDLDTNDDYDYEVLKEIDFLQQHYGCEIEFSMPLSFFSKMFDKKDMRFGFLNLEEKKSSLKVLRGQLALYPPEYIQKIKPAIILTKYNSLWVSGFCYAHEKRPHVVLMDMPFEADCTCTKQDSATVIHHELYHASDYQNGNADSYSVATKANNEEWEQLNGKEVNYAPFWGWRIRSMISYFIIGERDSRPEGFIEYYGQSEVDEDEATIAAHLMSNHIKPKDKLKEGPILKRKIEKIKQYMRERSNGRMDDQYWQDLEDGKVNEEYWDTK